MISQVRIRCSRHGNQYGSYFCGRYECIQKNPICVICALNEHKQHRSQPLKMILKKIQSNYNNSNANLILFSKIDLLKDKIYMLWKNIHSNNYKNIIKLSIDHYINILQQKISFNQIIQLQEDIIKYIKNEQGKCFQHKIIQKIIQYQKIMYLNQNEQEDKDTKVNYNYHRILLNAIDSLQDVTTNFEEMIKKQQIDSSTIEIFAPGIPKYHFNYKLKHSNLILVGQNIVKMPQQYAPTNYFALCNPKLSLDRPQSITFHMVKISSYITAGICKKDKISTTYQFNSSHSNHGTYQISFDGYSWCDGNTSLNQQYTGWYFNQGDKVTIQFNPKDRKIKFFKNLNQSQNYQIPIQFTKNQKLYFCVSLNSKPEQIHIIQ